MISKQEVQHIAQLARLGLTEEEIEKMQSELSSILDYMEKLKEVDIKGVKPTSHSVLIENIMRKDEVRREAPEKTNKLIKAAPRKEKGYIKVKAVL